MNVSDNKIIALQCKNCFSNNVNIDWDKNMFHCNSCGTYFKIDAESKKQIVNIYNQIVSVENNYNSIERLVKSADILMTKLGSFDKARSIYERITNEAPDDYRGWWGLIRADNYDLSGRLAYENGHDPHEYEDEKEDYFEYISVFAPESVAKKLIRKWDEYVRRYDKYANEIIMEELQSKIDEIDRKLNESRKKIEKSTYDYSVFCVKTVSIISAAVAILMILSDHGNGWNLLLIALICILLDFICYANLFNVVELVCRDFRELMESERAKIKKLSRERTALAKQLDQLNHEL